MFDFFRDLSVNLLLLSGLLAGLVASVACGIVGPYVVTRRIVFLGGAISHMAVGGLGAAIFLAATFPTAFGWLEPMHGLMLAAIASAILLAVVRHYSHERLDTLIGALWALGMSVGILLIKYTPGYQTELTTYLFGNIACVGRSDLIRSLCLDLFLIFAAAMWHKRLLAATLDEEHLSMQGISSLGTEIVLLCMVALTVIMLTQIVGMILVIAMLSLPAATVSRYVTRMGPFFFGTTLLCMGLMTIPRILVYGTRINPESAIVIAATLVYLLSSVWQWHKAA